MTRIKLKVPLDPQDEQGLHTLEQESDISIFGPEGFFQKPLESNVSLRFYNGHVIYFSLDSEPSRSYNFLQDFPFLQCLYLDQFAEPRILSRLPPMPNLRVLGLLSLDLTSLSSQITQYPNLEYLDLANNRLTRLPTFWDQLPRLRRINLGGNRISKLPRTFIQLKNLSHLNLEFNEFTTIPQEIFCIGNLKFVSFQDNPLSPRLQSFCQKHGFWVVNIHHPSQFTQLHSYLRRFPQMNHPMTEAEITTFYTQRGHYRIWNKVKCGYWNLQSPEKPIYDDSEFCYDIVREH